MGTPRTRSLALSTTSFIIVFAGLAASNGSGDAEDRHVVAEERARASPKPTVPACGIANTAVGMVR